MTRVSSGSAAKADSVAQSRARISGAKYFIPQTGFDGVFTCSCDACVALCELEPAARGDAGVATTRGPPVSRVDLPQQILHDLPAIDDFDGAVAGGHQLFVGVDAHLVVDG